MSLRISPGLAPERPGASAEVAVVLRFLAEVRLTGDEGAARLLMAARVPAHQVISERDHTVVRTPAEYAAHARDLLAATGDASFQVTELLADSDRVYVRWLLSRTHGPVVREVGSAVYRIEDGCIAEYWIQLDRCATPTGSSHPADREQFMCVRT